MSQADILELFRSDPKKWFDMNDIKEHLRSKGLGNGSLNAAYDDVYKLMINGDIKYKGVGVWNHKKVFKLRNKN